MTTKYQPNPKLDLVLERTVDISPEKIWKAWTTPELMMKWFTPAPWKTVDCRIDLRPGGEFMSVMRSPEGQDFPNTGCFLEIVPNEKLVWTDALGPDFRPAKEGFLTAMVLLEREGNGTKYTAIAIHKSEEDRKKHEEMGFETGWSQVLDQLVALMKTL